MKSRLLSLFLLFLIASCKSAPNLRGKYESVSSGLEFTSTGEVRTDFRNPKYSDFVRRYKLYPDEQGYLIKMFDAIGTSNKRIKVLKDGIVLEDLDGDKKSVEYRKVERFSWE
ncbi:MAG TPA: hypothetical protein IGS53_11270 [Leptolyngbyaceae cyanobacterium M33_DOE_097]|uniref:Lipoprotein n=1 Tax=Oscillatoriales cyanobacterium SpSt-418 TaxID=2282169 RepID=A0A7C3KGL3_9CYAN|nr:hypothetical protein [Leptolyngbyaceae cyanobacterium M33_DOE_097]